MAARADELTRQWLRLALGRGAAGDVAAATAMMLAAVGRGAP